MTEKIINYHNEYACLNPPKYMKQQCKECMFFNGCVLPDKLIGYKEGKPVRYKDRKKGEDQ